MTRLRSEDVAAGVNDLHAYDQELRRKTGTDLKGLACGAAGLEAETFDRLAVLATASAVPITAGGGIIPGFSEAVRRTLAHIGLAAGVTDEADVAGLAEAYRRRSELIFLADDRCFVSIHTRRLTVISNATATGTGYAWGLGLMAGGLTGRPVLVIGCGPVGCSATEALLALGARVHVFDVDRARACQLAAAMGAECFTVVVEEDFKAALARHPLLLDATPAAGIIDADTLNPGSCISAPGVPLGLTAEAVAKASDRILHDFLEIGVATMAALSLRSYER
jgi:pyrrolysine biosynthesis protein PylD